MKEQHVFLKETRNNRTNKTQESGKRNQKYKKETVAALNFVDRGERSTRHKAHQYPQLGEKTRKKLRITIARRDEFQNECETKKVLGRAENAFRFVSNSAGFNQFAALGQRGH